MANPKEPSARQERDSKSDDFDLSGLLTGPLNLMSGALGAADGVRKTFTGLGETVQSLQRAVIAMEQMATRMNRLLDDLETPVRALVPELERMAGRMGKFTELMDNASVSNLPQNLERLSVELTGFLDTLRDVPGRLGPVAGMFGLDKLFGGAASGAAAKPVPAAKPVVAKPVAATKPAATKPAAKRADRTSGSASKNT